jgi:hypothetical protein
LKSLLPWVLIFFVIEIFASQIVLASDIKSTTAGINERLSSHLFPKLFIQLQTYLPSVATVKEAANRDLIVADAEVVANNPEFLGASGVIRTLNPNAVILTYFSAADVIPGNTATINAGFIAGVKDAWYMKDVSGARFKLYELREGFWTEMLNLTTVVNNFMPKYLNNAVLSKGLVDGIFYDWINDDISWLNHRTHAPCGLPDIDHDGLPESDKDLNERWIVGTKNLLQNSSRFFPNGSLIIGNSGGVTKHTYGAGLDGLMIENFLGADWAYIMRKHLGHLKYSRRSTLSIIMANGKEKDYKTMRYSLCSTLMFNGYFTYTNKGSYLATWWYDEYSVDLVSGKSLKSLDHKGYLGKPVGDAYSVLNPQEKLKDILLSVNYSLAGTKVWRRDFTNGIVLINPSAKDVLVNLGGNFKKIKGVYDKTFNNGAKMSKIILVKKSGAVLLR